MAPLALALCALLALTAAVSAQSCYDCAFRFCYGPQRVLLGDTNAPLRGPICLGRTKIGVFNHRRALRPGDPHPRCAHLQVQPARTAAAFLETAFKGYPITTFLRKLNKDVIVSGVGHETMHKNQRKLITGKCVMLHVD